MLWDLEHLRSGWTSVKSLQDFLGMVNFYHRFIPLAAQLMQLRPWTAEPPSKWWSGLQSGSRHLQTLSLLWATWQCWHHHVPRLLSLTPETLWTTQLEHMSSLWMVRSSHWLTSADSHAPMNRSTAPLAENSLASTLSSVTSISCWRSMEAVHGIPGPQAADVCYGWGSWAIVCPPSFILEVTTDVQHVSGKNSLVTHCFSWTFTGHIHLGFDYTCMVVDQASDPAVKAYWTAVMDYVWRKWFSCTVYLRLH